MTKNANAANAAKNMDLDAGRYAFSGIPDSVPVEAFRLGVHPPPSRIIVTQTSDPTLFMVHVKGAVSLTPELNCTQGKFGDWVLATASPEALWTLPHDDFQALYRKL